MAGQTEGGVLTPPATAAPPAGPSAGANAGAGPSGPLARLRSAARTPPGRLRAAGALLAALVLLFGLAASWQSAGRSSATRQLASRSEPLSQDAAELYRSLADADATAAAGFLMAATEPPEVRKRYQDDLATASRLIPRAAARSGSSAEAQRRLAELAQQLPRYAGLVETARAINREGLPLGGAYLRYASDYMRQTVLPNAQGLADTEAAALRADYEAADAVPWAAMVLGVAALAALGRYQVLLFRRTKRVFNPGLLAASLAVLVALGWTVGGIASAGNDLYRARLQGIDPLRELNLVRVEALQAHTAENLNLVSRGATEAYRVRWDELAKTLNEDSGRFPGSVAYLLTAPPAQSRQQLSEAARWFGEWQQRHAAAAKLDEDGKYEETLAKTLAPGRDDTAQAAFDAADRQWELAGRAEQAAFEAAVDGVDTGLAVQAVAVALLAVLAAGGTVRGIGRRLAEYR
ncbi:MULTISPECIES: hypothetical protein [Kitasatospora]|uniref:Secreted protein n=1 Tax=Kitasatospora setae (strain ATCC 33774 / DSM 43861 / JCM 3304 / KCC A-0304 / NBRC 14216 / KM-6054) TaxID=452652 RepID=E4NIB6_KITSK|nr:MULTISPECIES: hypothetical protein [Kitasatospora]BAJ31246.1 hypothetical protein KSE_54710 [Kitasatospora setae KM-6054]